MHIITTRHGMSRDNIGVINLIYDHLFNKVGVYYPR